MNHPKSDFRRLNCI